VETERRQVTVLFTDMVASRAFQNARGKKSVDFSEGKKF
jgi:hypothetical protein